jgi:hypothetical protein
MFLVVILRRDWLKSALEILSVILINNFFLDWLKQEDLVIINLLTILSLLTSLQFELIFLLLGNLLVLSLITPILHIFKARGISISLLVH